MSTRGIVALCGGALVLAAAILGALAWCGKQEDPLQPATRAAIDSLHRTKPAADSTRAATHRAELAAVDTATAAHRSATTTRANAEHVKHERDSLSHVADSLATVAARDSSWHAAYDAEHAAKLAGERLADSLAAAADSADLAYQYERAARILADARAAGDSTRLAAAEHTVDVVAADAENAGRCRVLWVVPCPSRKAAVVAGVAIGTVTTIALELVAQRAKR